MKIINQEKQYERDSKIKSIKNKITGMTQGCRKRYTKEHKMQIIQTSTTIKSHKSRIWSFSSNITFTTRKRRLYNHNSYFAILYQPVMDGK